MFIDNLRKHLPSHKIADRHKKLVNRVLIGLLFFATLIASYAARIFTITLHDVESIGVRIWDISIDDDHTICAGFYCLVDQADNIDVMLTDQTYEIAQRLYLVVLVSCFMVFVLSVHWIIIIWKSNLTDQQLSYGNKVVGVILVGLLMSTELENSVYISKGSIQQRLTIGYLLYTPLACLITIIVTNLIFAQISSHL